MEFRGTLLARDIMNRSVAVLSPRMSVIEAAGKFIEFGVSGMPVVNEDLEILGYLTQYDIFAKGGAISLASLARLDEDRFRAGDQSGSFRLYNILPTVEEVMDPDPLIFHEEAELSLLLKVFTESREVVSILIVNGRDQLAGIISRADMLRYYIDLLDRDVSSAAPRYLSIPKQEGLVEERPESSARQKLWAALRPSVEE